MEKQKILKGFGRNNHLYNCPFCNGSEIDGIVLLGYKYPKYRVTCTSCGVMVEDDRKDKVQAAWNMRGGISWMEQTLLTPPLKAK